MGKDVNTKGNYMENSVTFYGIKSIKWLRFFGINVYTESEVHRLKRLYSNLCTNMRKANDREVTIMKLDGCVIHTEVMKLVNVISELTNDDHEDIDTTGLGIISILEMVYSNVSNYVDYNVVKFKDNLLVNKSLEETVETLLATNNKLTCKVDELKGDVLASVKESKAAIKNATTHEHITLKESADAILNGDKKSTKKITELQLYITVGELVFENNNDKGGLKNALLTLQNTNQLLTDALLRKIAKQYNSILLNKVVFPNDKVKVHKRANQHTTGVDLDKLESALRMSMDNPTMHISDISYKLDISYTRLQRFLKGDTYKNEYAAIIKKIEEEEE